MLAENTITVPVHRLSVTHGFCLCALLSSALAFAPAASAADGEPEDRVAATNVFTHGALTVHQLTVGHLSANCFVVADAGKRALVIDPGACPASIAAYLRGAGLHVAAYVLTHSHLDHLSALDELAEALPAEVAMHPEEGDWAFCEKNAWEPYYPRTRETAVTRPLRHQQAFEDGGLSYVVLHTPGHSPGSVCIWFPRERVVFSGDTLFAGTVGRTDLHRSSSTSLIRSLGVFLALPTDTAVYAGHGRPTTVGAELKSNPFMQDVPNPPKGEARGGGRKAAPAEGAH
jgi:glyoxylase-like metal-dependent hydrolase (beta-lactamase superfamily II)